MSQTTDTGEQLAFAPVPFVDDPPQWELGIKSEAFRLDWVRACMRTEQGFRTIRFDQDDLRRLIAAAQAVLGDAEASA